MTVRPTSTATSSNISWELPTKPCVLTVTGSVYWGVESQTDNTPNKTACQNVFDPLNPPRYIALSRDVEAMLGLSCGDVVTVKGNEKVNGEWVFTDRMNKRWTLKVDFLVKPGIMGLYKNLTILKK